MFEKRKITVNGVAVEADTSALEIDSIDEAQKRAAPLMAFWASVWASAEQEHAAADALYRRWRAKKAEAVMAADPKAAEWKVKAAIESDDKFLEYKNAMAKALENTVLAKGMYEAAEKRANMAQSMGAKQREIYNKTGSATRARPTSESSDDDDEPKGAGDSGKSRLKNILSKDKDKKGGD